MSVSFIIYDTATGEIASAGTCLPQRLAIQSLEPGQAIMIGSGQDNLHYVVDGAIVPRPSFDITSPLAIPIGTTVTVSLPAGTQINPNGITLADGVLELEGEMPDEYELTLSLWPYLDKTVKVVVA